MLHPARLPEQTRAEHGVTGCSQHSVVHVLHDGVAEELIKPVIASAST